MPISFRSTLRCFKKQGHKRVCVCVCVCVCVGGGGGGGGGGGDGTGVVMSSSLSKDNLLYCN